MFSKKNKFYVSELLDLSKYTFERALADDDWDQFIERSPQGTVFSSSVFLQATGQKLSLWKVFKNNEWVGVVVTGESDDGKSTCLIPFAIYGGIIKRQSSLNQPLPQIQTEEFRLIAAAIGHLSATYRNVQLGLCPELRDMRPFLWHNYGEDGDKFILDLRYTSLVSLENSGVSVDLDKNNVYKSSSKSRRQEIRYGVKAGVTTRSIDQIDDFMHFYEMTFARQGISLDREEHETVRRICIALQNKNMINMYGTYTAEDDLASIFVFARDSKRAYYLFGANHPSFRDSYSGTLGLFQSLNMLADTGCSEVDLEGVNSPKRGYFKLSFGGTLTPYYRVTLHQQ